MDDAGVRADDESMPARHRRGWVLAGAALVVLLLSGASSHDTTAPSAIGSVALHNTAAIHATLPARMMITPRYSASRRPVGRT